MNIYHIRMEFKRLANFELIGLAGLLALLGDVVWLVHDIVANGLNLWYVTVGTLFAGSIIATIIVLLKFHKELKVRRARKARKQLLVLARI